MKKRIFAVMMAATMVFSLVGCGSKAPANDGATADASSEAKADGADATEATADFKVAMVTDYGDITDQSFNQSTYEACQAFCNESAPWFPNRSTNHSALRPRRRSQCSDL